MVHLNKTKNQHFISQAELRLNAINPTAKDENQRIYSFEVDDRESFSLKLSSDKGFKINRSLSLNDLFSFDVQGGNEYRHNFENLFNKYEDRIKADTVSLLEKLSSKNDDIKEEILNLYVAKFLNFIRNPYSVNKVLNTFSTLQRFKPTIEPVKSNFERLLAGNRPQQDYLCSKIGISEQDYVKWLGTLFMLLSEYSPNQPNFMEEIIRGVYENPNNVVFVMVYTYKRHTCVVSDRGYTIPLVEGKHMAFDFNLNSSSFIRYMFGDLEELTPANTPRKVVELYKAMPKEVKVFSFENDMDELKVYNQRTVYQCYERVYSSSLENYGL